MCFSCLVQYNTKQILVLLGLLLFSCDEINLDLTDCIVRKSTELPDKLLKPGHTGKYYYDELKASVSNDPDDDGYYYNFYVEENLPEGINVSFDGRYVIFEGITLRKGQFNIYISLVVEPYEDDEVNIDLDLCPIGSIRKRYTLEIGP
ncbi:hypothetical protein [Formosa sp. S-31]|uniref:hypothetical protein n=1 Tax=Formosa sp. S-31 TaxID=2790949 RepID=UPI003EBA9ACF